MCTPAISLSGTREDIDGGHLGLPQLQDHPVVQRTAEAQAAAAWADTNEPSSGHPQVDKGREKLLIASSISMATLSRAYMLTEKVESKLVPVLICSGYMNFSQLPVPEKGLLTGTVPK
jgi:hypothetical protein